MSDPQQPGCEAGRPPATPWWCWALLCASVLAVSSAGVAFTLMAEVPPLTLASWRLQLTALITIAAACVQWQAAMPAAARARFRADLPLTALSGVALALHFATWVWSLQHTSLAHSLLLVSTSPIINVGVALAAGHAISAGEIGGALLALAGCGVLAAGALSGKEVAVTLAGDVAAFVAALAVVAHWHIGQKLRSYQPVFVYSAPVTAAAAALLTLAGVVFETRSLLGAPGQRHGAIAWLLSVRFAPLVLYLGTVPGIVGHQGFNTVLKYITPLLVSLAVQFEPVLGPLLGWATGVAAAPGLFTWIGGSIVLGATLVASLATARRQQQEEEDEAEQSARRLVKNKSLLPSTLDDDDVGCGSGDAVGDADADGGSGARDGGGGGSGGRRGGLGGGGYAALAAVDDDACHQRHRSHHHQQQQHALLAAAESGELVACDGGGAPGAAAACAAPHGSQCGGAARCSDAAALGEGGAMASSSSSERARLLGGGAKGPSCYSEEGQLQPPHLRGCGRPGAEVEVEMGGRA